MAKTYAQLMAEIDALKVTAEALRNKERGGVIDRIKVAIDHYGLTAEDLGLTSPATKGPKAAAPKKSGAPKANASAKSSARYSDGAGNAWTGMGPKPKWFKAALEAGRTLESLMSAPGAGSGSFQKAKAKESGSGKGKGTIPAKYRDDAGNSWSGRGSQPRWLRDALASGKTIDQMKIN